MSLGIDKQYTTKSKAKFDKLYDLTLEHPLFNEGKGNIEYITRWRGNEITVHIMNVKSPLRLITMYQYLSPKIELNYNIKLNRKLYECDVNLINTYVEALLELIKKVEE